MYSLFPYVCMYMYVIDLKDDLHNLGMYAHDIATL